MARLHPQGSVARSVRRRPDRSRRRYLARSVLRQGIRSRLKPFVTLARTIRKRRAGILVAIRLGITNARHEGLDRRVRLIVNRAYGFHSANAALGLIMLTLGPINHVLPHERTTPADP